MKIQKTDGKYKSITIRNDIYEEFEKLRGKQQADLGLAELSWSNYVAMLVQRMKTSIKKQ